MTRLRDRVEDAVRTATVDLHRRCFNCYDVINERAVAVVSREISKICSQFLLVKSPLSREQSVSAYFVTATRGCKFISDDSSSRNRLRMTETEKEGERVV